MKKLLTIGSVLFALFAFNSCGDEPDYRDEFIGSYGGTMAYADSEGDAGTYSTVVVVSKGSSDKVVNLVVEDVYGTEHLFYAEDLEECEEGYAFKIRTVNDGGTVYCGGEDYKLEGKVKDGYFNIDSKKITFGLLVTESDYIEAYEFEGIKK